MTKINLDREWEFIVREMRAVPREFPPMVVAYRHLLFVMRDILSNGNPGQYALYQDFKKIYKRHKKFVLPFFPPPKTK